MRAPIILVLVSMILHGCVARSTHEDLKAELKRAQAENGVLTERLSAQKMQDVRSLEIQLKTCNNQITTTKEAGERLAQKAEQAGYYKGASDFNRSLQVVGAPTSDGWWIFAEHYYTFQVRLAGEPLYSMTVETEEKMPPLVQGMALLAELSEIMPFKPRL